MIFLYGLHFLVVCICHDWIAQVLVFYSMLSKCTLSCSVVEVVAFETAAIQQGVLAINTPNFYLGKIFFSLEDFLWKNTEFGTEKISYLASLEQRGILRQNEILDIWSLLCRKFATLSENCNFRPPNFSTDNATVYKKVFVLFLLLACYVPNVAKRSIWDQCNIEDQSTVDLHSWKSLPGRTSNGYILIMV